MEDPRLRKLARLLVNYSTAVKPGDNVLIENVNPEPDFLKLLIEEVHAAGAKAFLSLRDRHLERTLFADAPEEQFALQAEFECARMEKMQVYIGFTSMRNSFAWKDLPSDQAELYNSYIWKKVHIERRVPHTRWVVLRYPSPAMAQNAGMSEDSFEQFYFDVCTMDYQKMSRAMGPLKALLERSDRVKILGPGTDLEFSVKGMPAIKCDGTMNIPDGEVYTAPLRESVNGVLSYNTPSEKDGFKFEQIVLTFKNGKIVEARANDSARINKILDIDPGARYLGEFAFGLNPYITSPMLETLFDEKIAGSLHITPGNSYDDCDNGNHSALHWDIVLMQDEASGGGEVWIDDVLVRKNGIFVLPELAGLNPEALKG